MNDIELKNGNPFLVNDRLEKIVAVFKDGEHVYTMILNASASDKDAIDIYHQHLVDLEEDQKSRELDREQGFDLL